MEIYHCVNCMEEVKKAETRCPHCGYDLAGYKAPPGALRQDVILRGRYLVGRVLEQDGSGNLYAGLDLKLGLKVAVRESDPGTAPGNGIGDGRDFFEENHKEYLITDMTESMRKTGNPFRFFGKRGKILVGAAAVAAAGAGAFLTSARDGAHETAELLGSSNANQFQGANFSEIAGEYLYYVDGDWNLYVCPWDEKEKSYHPESGRIVDPEAGFINIGRDKIYFIHDNGEDETGPDVLMEMDPDGSHVKSILSGGYYSNLQYVCDSSGNEMLYYLKDNGDSEDLLYTLWRYDLEKGTEERVIKEDVHWYNIDGEYIYYTSFTMETWLDRISFKRAYLDGRKSKTLDKDHFLINGFVEDGKACLFSIESKQLMAYDPGSQVLESLLEEHSETIFHSCSVYDDGWIYYSPEGSGRIHKIRMDGTEERVIYSGEHVLQINCLGDTLWFLTGSYLEETDAYQISHAFTMSTDGKQLSAMGEYQSRDGLIYRAEDGEITLTGYTGERDYMVVPREFEEGVWRGALGEQFPDQVDLYRCVEESSLSYEKTEDGAGIILRGYSGKEKFITFPEEIEGLPVTVIGSNFSLDGDAETAGIVFPEHVERIEEDAFINNSFLEKAVFPKGLKYIGSSAFFGTDIKELVLPADLETYYAGAFAGVEKIVLDGESENFQLDDEGVLYRRNTLVVLLVPTTKTGDYTVSDGSEGVASMAFQDSQLTSVTLPGSVTNVYNRGFYRAEKLQKVVLSEGTESLGKHSFARCVSLTEIRIPESVKVIDERAFYGCVRLKSVTVSRDCQIADDAFDEGVTINYYD